MKELVVLSFSIMLFACISSPEVLQLQDLTMEDVNEHALTETPAEPVEPEELYLEAENIVRDEAEIPPPIIPYYSAPILMLSVNIAEPKLQEFSEQLIFRRGSASASPEEISLNVPQLPRNFAADSFAADADTASESQNVKSQATESQHTTDILSVGAASNDAQGIGRERVDTSYLEETELEEDDPVRVQIAERVQNSEQVQNVTSNLDSILNQDDFLLYRGLEVPVDTTFVRVDAFSNIFSVPLAGRNWVFLEASEDIRYQSKNTSEEFEEFNFIIEEGVGENIIIEEDSSLALLYFQRQNLEDGSIEYRAVRVQEDSTASTDLTAESTALANARDATLTEASISENSNEVLSTAVLDSVLQEPVSASIDEASTPEEDEEIADSLALSGEYISALNALKTLRMRYPAYAEQDRVLFKIAQLLERPEIQRIQAAFNSYNEILMLFPYSQYTVDAQERIRYLQRNILKVF